MNIHYLHLYIYHTYLHKLLLSRVQLLLLSWHLDVEHDTTSLFAAGYFTKEEFGVLKEILTTYHTLFLHYPSVLTATNPALKIYKEKLLSFSHQFKTQYFDDDNKNVTSQFRSNNHHNNHNNGHGNNNNNNNNNENSNEARKLLLILTI